MSTVLHRPVVRWAAPVVVVAVVAVVGVGVAAASAEDRPDLPPRSAEQLLADLAEPTTTLSGTVALHADLGLPEIPGLGGGVAGTGVVPGDAASLPSDTALSGGASDALGAATALLSGDHTLRVWADGPQRSRVAVLGDGEETDLIRDGADVWLWQSAGQRVLHATLPDAEPAAHDPDLAELLDSEDLADLVGPGHGDPDHLAGLLDRLPTTPQEAAARLLAALDPTTEVTTDATATVAGRAAYRLVATPRTADTLVARVVVAVDAETHVPLSLAVYSTRLTEPAFSAAFTSIDYATPDASVFAFEPPAGAQVTELPGDLPEHPTPPPADDTALPDVPRPDVTVVGEGWAAVVVVTPAAGDGDATGTPDGELLAALPTVSGPWGTGHALAGTLFSVLVADDGRVAAGAVPVEALEGALAGTTQ